ncbi:MAG TPA: MFS transporter [Actinomycetes bacterium]|nr:MFS transporter [Actinomycetes bacterium]
MRTRVVVVVYLALFVGELSWSGVTPLIPSYVDKYDLTDFEGGLVLSIASLGILLASLPARALTQRISPRTLTLTSMMVIAIAGLAMAVAPTYAAIILARFIFGLGFGILWVAMAAWLADAAGSEAPRVLALTTAIVGFGATLAPAYAGWVAEHFGLSAPFVGLAIVTLALFVLLLTDRSGTGLNKDPAPPARELVRAAHSDPDLVTMLLLTTAAAVVWMTADLLVPLRLDRGGFDVSTIGIVFSVSAVVFVGASALTARRADRLATPRVAAIATGCLAVVTFIPAVSLGVPAALIFLVGAAIATGVIVALTFPFGLYSVARGAVTVAVMSALANIIWALSGMAGPTVGGAFAEWAGDGPAFAVLALVSAVVTVIMVRRSASQSPV